ncbi:MAG: glycosyltransferase family 4 protein [Actinomycetia bacterium]|nr:glycosyltransferase family 4 protein [Actinomycetes bacterium]
MSKSAPVRIALYSDAYDDYTTSLANAIARQDRTLLTLVQPLDDKRTPPSEIHPGVELVRIPKPRIRDPRGLIASWRIVDRLLAMESDVVHVQQSGDPVINLALASRRSSCPVLMTVHDVVRHPGDRTYRAGAIPSQKLFARRVDRFLVHGEVLGRALEDNWGVPRARSVVVPHGELGSLYREAGAPTQVAREPGRLLFFGRRWAYKGLDVLVDALVRLVPDPGKPVTLVIAGKGEPIELPTEATPPWLSFEIFDRYLDREEVVRQFDLATAVILPYREASQSGVAALALGLGTPLVATTVGGLADLLDESIATLVAPGDPVSLAEALSTLLAGPGPVLNKAEAGLLLAGGALSWDAVAEQHLSVYRDVIGPGLG